jgi:acyl carrier protein
MKTADFIEKLKLHLDFQKVEMTEDTNLRTIDGFDSMSIMTIIAIVDEFFAKKLTAKQLASFTTVRSLKELIGPENFSD